MATVTMENEASDFSEFIPFNDTNEPRIKQAKFAVGRTKQGIDTSAYDSLRQGVSLRTDRHRFSSTQPKIWAGNLNHFVLVRTIGQARSFTEFENSAIFEELPRFNPVQYIEDSNYPFPITFNNGPQQEEEAIIEPFVIKFRKNDNEGRFPARSVKGRLEDGNYFDAEDGAANRIEQFIELTPPTEARFFLDEGQGYFGLFPTASHLDTTFNPAALFLFDGNTDDSSGNSIFIEKITGSVAYEQGPFPGSQALVCDGNLIFSSSLSAPFILTGSVTIQGFFKPARAGSGPDFPVSLVSSGETSQSNGLGNIFMNSTLPGTVGFSLEKDFGESFNYLSDAGVVQQNQWAHIANVRDGNTTKLYINGILLTEVSHPGFPNADPVLGNNTQKLYLGGGFAGGPDTILFGFTGSLSNIKITSEVLTGEQVRKEYSRLFPIESGAVNEALANSVVIPGFTPLIQREISPFNDTKNERIVDRIQTTNSEFISVLKALKFDLDGDIRESFDKKSARAGNTVYGPNAAIVGTDSFAYIGRIRGA